jgi:tRNA modification GTPase
VVLYLVDSSQLSVVGSQVTVDHLKKEIEQIRNKYPSKTLLTVINKKDLLTSEMIIKLETELTTDNRQQQTLFISAKNKIGIDELKQTLLSFVNTGALRNNETIVTNTRHYDSLLKALEEIQKVKWGLESNLSSDLMAIDIREALFHFGEITGEVTNDELLGNIFANFCIGK